jgi:hypothetical protein
MAVTLAAETAQAETVPADLSEATDAAALAPEGRVVEVDVGGMIVDGNRRRMRELARTPTYLWGAARLFAPVDWGVFRGRLRVEATTMGTGLLDLDGHLADDSRLVLRFSRLRFPFAAESRTGTAPLALDAQALGNLEQTREEALLRYERPLGPADGRLYVRLDFQHLAGDRPMLTTGLVSGSPLDPRFGNPAIRGTDDMTGGAQLGYANVPRGVRILIQGGLRYDHTEENWTIRDRLGAQATGLLSLHENMRRRTMDLLVSAANDEPAVLMAGASYRVVWTANGPRTQRTEEGAGVAAGSINGQDMRVTLLRNQVALGAAWRPVAQLRLAGRLDGRVNDLDGDGVQTRNLGTLQTVRADTSREDWTITGRLDGSYTIIPALTLQLDARGEMQKGQDDWTLRYLLPDAATTAGERLRQLDRQRLLGIIEIALLTRLGTRWRLTVGSRLEGLHSDEDVKQLVDAFRLGDRGRTRWGAFVAARARPSRRLLVNAQSSVFRNTWDQSGGRDRNWRIDVRLRGTVLAGPFTLFGMGAFTEDDHQLSGPTALPGFARIDFEGRSWLALGGASVGVSRTSWASVTYSHLINTADFTTRLQDLAVAASWHPPWKALRVGATARYLSFHDRARPWDKGKAVLLLATAGAPF